VVKEAPTTFSRRSRNHRRMQHQKAGAGQNSSAKKKQADPWEGEPYPPLDFTTIAEQVLKQLLQRPSSIGIEED
jgi:hypothetical protein